MILALNTSTATCKVWIIDGDNKLEYSWEAGRGLADGLIGYLRAMLHDNGADWRDMTGIIAYRGPGSFTGLRIGLTVLNTIADDRGIPIVAMTGGDWLVKGLSRISSGESDVLAMPLYGKEPNITTPRK
jgi:tRNA threonylcarbamoyladenosine biosynthesis protein TsaB